MRRALSLARRGQARVSPNPMVGAVVVKDGAVISEGYHRMFGGPHAEVDALQSLDSAQTSGATLYVNLEPCSHHGKTPPCVERIVEMKLARVVVGMQDPNPLVAGRGIRRLRDAGIDVGVSCLEDECRTLNAHFSTYITQKRAFATLKIAQTLDGRIATQSGASQWITSDRSRKVVQRLRREHDAVLVGLGTIIQDDPSLTDRGNSGKRRRVLQRIILDPELRTPPKSRVVQCSDPENTTLYCGSQADRDREQRLRSYGVGIYRMPLGKTGLFDIQKILSHLASHDIASVLVEGGQKVFTSFFRQNLVDRFVVFIAPSLFGNGPASLEGLPVSTPSRALRFKNVHWRRSGTDIMLEATDLCLPD